MKSQDRQFKPGDEVLVLLPDSSSKLLMSWRGPFKVLEKRSRVNYIIDENGKGKLYHANLLKKYHRRAVVSYAQVIDEQERKLELPNCPLMATSEQVEEDPNVEDTNPITPDGETETLSPDSLMIPDICKNLSESQKETYKRSLMIILVFSP